MMLSSYTVESVRSIGRYSLHKEQGVVDPFVERVVESAVDASTLSALREFSRSQYDGSLHYRSFMQYSRDYQAEEGLNLAWKSSPDIRYALDKLDQELGPILASVEQWPRSKLEQVPFTGNSAAGFSYEGKKRDNHQNAIIRARDALGKFELIEATSYRFTPDKAFARCQLSKLDDPKVRHVWGRAFHNQLIEGLTAQPILDVFVRTESPIYLGRDLFRDMPTDMARLRRDAEPYFYGLDFSSFDASCCAYAVQLAWSLIEKHIKITDPVAFRYAKEIFRRTPVVMPDGMLYIVRTGIPSGSMFTSFVDSLVNLLLIYAMQHHFEMQDLSSTRVLGDDSAFFSSTFVTREALATFFTPLGFSLNLKKSIISQNESDIYFLGHSFLDGRVHRDDFTLLSLALFPEDPVLSPEESVVRVAGLLLDSGMHSNLMLQILKTLCAVFDLDLQSLPNPVISVDRMFEITRWR